MTTFDERFNNFRSKCGENDRAFRIPMVFGVDWLDQGFSNYGSRFKNSRRYTVTWQNFDKFNINLNKQKLFYRSFSRCECDF